MFGSRGGLSVKVQFGHQWVAVCGDVQLNDINAAATVILSTFLCLSSIRNIEYPVLSVLEYLLGVGDPGRLLGPVSAACGLKELVLTVGMALLTRRPHVAMLMFI